jgi:hypothetical protein
LPFGSKQPKSLLEEATSIADQSLLKDIIAFFFGFVAQTFQSFQSFSSSQRQIY